MPELGKVCMEVWKPVEGFPGYEVSSHGQVRSPRKILKPWVDDGYNRVGLCINGRMRVKRVHRLVAEAFIERIDGKHEVDHINRDRLDNNVANLRWADDMDQMQNCERVAGRLGHRNIYKSYNLYMVTVCRNKVRTLPKYFKTLEEAIIYRDSLR